MSWATRLGPNATRPEVFVVYEELTVTKTVETYFERTHEWDIDKYVETEFGYELDGFPKIWLYEDGSGDECALWTIDVTYEGYEDSDFNVSGTVTIENTGTADAVITDVEDLLGGTSITVDFGVTFPYTLEVGETLEGTYSEDDYFDGDNVVTVTTERDSYDATEPIVWGEPDDVINETVNIWDDSDEYGYVYLSSVTAPNGDQFTYNDCFAWAAYINPDPASWEINNTATIIETDQSSDAKLKINWLYEELTVEKTATGRYLRTHEWDIDKSVETEYEHELDGFPKVWLVQDGSGDETATWSVCVEYVGYEDHDFTVFGTVTIENTGTTDAVITGVDDYLCGTLIDVDFGVTFPYTLEVGETLEGTYSEDVPGMLVDCENVVTVTTEVDVYGDSALVDWEIEPYAEYFDVVNIVDDSKFLADPNLGTLDAADYEAGDVVCFTYDQFFAWTDYDAEGPYVYDNTATIVETDQSDSARLIVNWTREELCWGDETAWAYGGGFANPNWDYVNNKFWGWTNGPLGAGNYTWDIYAGAGQNDLSKGTVVGTLYVEYDGDCVTVTYQLDDFDEGEGYYLGETHLWVGCDVLPEVTRGRSTVYTNAPGQFPYGSHVENNLTFDPDDPTTWETEWTWEGCGFGCGGEGIYVAAHAVVWMEVQCPEEPID